MNVNVCVAGFKKPKTEKFSNSCSESVQRENSATSKSTFIKFKYPQEACP